MNNFELYKRTTKHKMNTVSKNFQQQHRKDHSSCTGNNTRTGKRHKVLSKYYGIARKTWFLKYKKKNRQRKVKLSYWKWKINNKTNKIRPNELIYQYRSTNTRTRWTKYEKTGTNNVYTKRDTWYVTNNLIREYEKHYPVWDQNWIIEKQKK